MGSCSTAKFLNAVPTKQIINVGQKGELNWNWLPWPTDYSNSGHDFGDRLLFNNLLFFMVNGIG